MTFCFIQAIEREHGSTYGSILNAMRTAIRNAGDTMSGGAVTSILAMLLSGGSLGGGLRQVNKTSPSSTSPFLLSNFSRVKFQYIAKIVKPLHHVGFYPADDT